MKYFIFLLLIQISLQSKSQEVPYSLDIADTVFYPIDSDRQLIEIDMEVAWQRKVDWYERSQPRAMHWSQLIPMPERNVLLVYHKRKGITTAFNTGQPVSYWNTQLMPEINKMNYDPARGIRLGGNKYRTHLSGQSYPYMDNRRVRTHMPNNCFIVDNVIPAPLQSLHIFDGKHLGVIDSTGQFILPVIYEYVEAVGIDFLVKKNGLFGIMDKKAATVLSPIYETATIRDDGSVVFGKKGRGKKVYKVRKGTP